MTVPMTSTTALIVVDVQNDFADPAGSLAVPGGVEVVSAVNRLVETAIEAKALVFYTQDWHPTQTPHFVSGGGPWPPHCVRKTWGAELHPELLVRGEVVRKGVDGEDGYSGFSMRNSQTGEQTATPLAELLCAADVEHVVVVGLATDYCVRATALDARELGWPVTLVRQAVAAVDLAEGDGERALGAMVDAGVLVL